MTDILFFAAGAILMLVGFAGGFIAGAVMVMGSRAYAEFEDWLDEEKPHKKRGKP